MRKSWRRLTEAFVFKAPSAEPVIVDKTLARFIAVSYLLLTLWGVMSVAGSAPALAVTVGYPIAFVWAVLVTVLAGTAFVGSAFALPRTEMYAVSILIGVVGLYPAAIVVLVAADAAHLSSVFLTGYMLALPIWRLRFLIRKVRRAP